MVESEKAPTPVHIIVDHREKASGVHEHLLALPNGTIEFKELAFGDYWVDDQLGPERAEELLNKFLTVEKVMSAAQSDLEAIAGIGPKTASAIRSVLS